MTTGVNTKHLAKANVARVQARMVKDEVDALVLAKNETTRYLTGYQRYFCASYLPFVHAVVLFQDRGPFLLLPSHIMAFGDRCYSEEVRLLPMNLDGQSKAITSLLKTVDRKGAKVATELDFMHAGFMRLLEGGLENASIIDSAPVMERVMAIKSPDELTLIRKSAALNDAVIRSIFEKAKPGLTELELGAEASIALGGGAEFINHLCIRSQENAFELGPINTARKLSDGDTLQLDTGFIYRGYVSDVNRTKILGQPTERQKDVIKTVVGVHMELMEMMKPGTCASEIYNRCADLFRASRFGDDFRMPFIAHGIGMQLHEYPYVTPTQDALLEEGMVLALEPGIYVPNQGTCRMENVFVITNKGYDLITDLPDDLALNGIN
jgi:Xaa-Pro aminopeptidase